MHAGIKTAAAIITAISGTAMGQAADWNNALGGDWNTASNWTPGVVPNGATFDAALGLGAAYTVDFNLIGSLGTLSITNPLVSLEIAANRTLTISNGSVFNDGMIRVNPLGSIFDTRMIFNNTTSISGAGEIVLGAMSEIGATADARIEIDGLFDVTIGADQVIRGNGELRGPGTYINLGTIRSEDPLGPGINIATAIDQTGGGTIDVAGGVVMFSNNSILMGSQITGSGDGVVQVSGSPAIMSDVTFNAPVEILGGSDTLSLVGPIVNNNTITLNPDELIFNSLLRFDADASITGNGDIVMVAVAQQNDAQFGASAGFTGTIGSGQSVSGQGIVFGSLVLEGTMTATGDGTVNLVIQDSISGSGTLSAIEDASLLFESANIFGLSFDSSDSGIVAASSGVTFMDDIHILGNAGIAGGNARVSLLGDIVNDGLITLNYTDTVFNAFLDFESDASILGNGDIRMITSGNFGDAQIVTSDLFVGTFSPGQRVAGSGIVSGTFVNNGVFDGDDPAATLQLSGTFTGSGALESNGGEVSFSSFDLSDHTLSTSAGGLITVTSGVNSITGVVNTGDLGLNGSNTRLAINGSFTNNGNVLVNVTDTVFNAVLGVNTESTIDGTGTINLETSGNLGDARIEAQTDIAATFGPDQSISGSGIISGDVTILGSIDPSGDLRELAAQNGTLTTTGTSVFDLGGLLPAEFDRITTASTTTVELGGSIEVNLDDGYTPEFGDEWQIIGGSGATTIVGSYDTYNLPPAPPSLVYRVFIESDRVFVRLTCGADFTGDADSNFFDISTYITLFNAGDLRADLAAPLGALNFFDIAAYIAIFNSGCN